MNRRKIRKPTAHIIELVQRKGKRKKAGAPPGSLVYTGEKKVEKVRISYIQYDENLINEKDETDVEECLSVIRQEPKIWINVEGLHEVGIIEKIGHPLKLHSLLLEDILSTDQRPKIDEYEDNQNLFIVVRMFTYNKTERHLESEQVSMVLGKSYLITFQERQGDVFGPVRERIRKGRGRIRKSNIDYLAYTLMDAMVDHYFTVLEDIGNALESVEQELLFSYDESLLGEIHGLRRQLIMLRKSVWPLREVVSRYEKGIYPLVESETRVFIRDLYDHTIQVIDTIETFRDILSGLYDMYMTSVSNHMNQIMKVLTVIATIFIPLTFIAGIYGMNFHYIPELEYRYAYFVVWGFMILIALGMMLFFKRKGWF